MCPLMILIWFYLLILNANKNFHIPHSSLKSEKCAIWGRFFFNFIERRAGTFFSYYFGGTVFLFWMHFYTTILTVISKKFSIIFSAVWKSTFLIPPHIGWLHFVLGSYSMMMAVILENRFRFLLKIENDSLHDVENLYHFSSISVKNNYVLHVTRKFDFRILKSIN